VTVGLSQEMAVAMVWADDGPDQQRSALDEYDGKPPSLDSPERVREFLEISANEVTQLYKLGVIAKLGEEQIGQDADQVMSAARFLKSLLSTSQISALVGVNVGNDDLYDQSLFPRWNGIDQHDARVIPQAVLELQLQLIAAWHRSHPIAHRRALRSLIALTERPLDLITAVVKDIIMGSIKNFAWSTPFSWIDIEINPQDCPALASLLGHMPADLTSNSLLASREDEL
jgi:hypothetical protein